MNDQSAHADTHPWEHLTPNQVLTMLAYELYNPVSLLSSQFQHLLDDDEPLTEEEYDAIFEQMQEAVRQLSKTVVNLKQYTRIPHSAIPPHSDQLE